MRFRSPRKRSSVFPKNPQLLEATDPIRQEEEALSSIFGKDFEALSSWEWRVNVGHGTFLHVELPSGYPATEPPKVGLRVGVGGLSCAKVQVECPHGKAPEVQVELENCWGPRLEPFRAWFQPCFRRFFHHVGIFRPRFDPERHRF